MNYKVGDKFKVNKDALEELYKENLEFKNVDKVYSENRLITILGSDFAKAIVFITFEGYDGLWSVTFENFRKYFIPIESSNNFEFNLKPIKYIPLNQNN